MKVLFIILDGAAEPHGSRSALAEADMHHLNQLASVSECGMWTGPDAANYNPKNMSSIATLEILGYSSRDEPGRGYLEALGIGLMPKKNSISLRANFCTVDKNLNIIDRRAGRDYTGLDDLANLLNQKIKKIGDVSIRLYRSVGHRNVLVLNGRGLSKNVSDSDSASKKAEKIKALDKKSQKLAEILNKYNQLSGKILSESKTNKIRKIAVNWVLLRAAGTPKNVKSFRKSFGYNACSISNVGIIKGVSKYLGIDIINTHEPDEDCEKDMTKKTRTAINSFDRYDFVILHINGADICAHDRNFRKKVEFLEKVDREVFSQAVSMKDIIIAVVCDHATSSKTGEHFFGPVPFMIYSPYHDDIVPGRYNEKECIGFVTDSPMKKIIAIMGEKEK